MLTKSDLKLIQKLFSDEFSEKFSAAKKSLREDIVTFKDQILTEIKKLREDVAVITGYKDQIEDHETRIEKLEGILEPNN